MRNADHYLSLQDQLTPLMLAAREGHTAVMNELLTRQDLNINMTSKVHSVSLHTHHTTMYFHSSPHVCVHVFVVSNNYTVVLVKLLFSLSKEWMDCSALGFGKGTF